MDGFSITRAAVYVATMLLGVIAAWLAAAGFGTYDETTQLYTLTVDVKVFAAYIGALVGGGGTAFTALIRGWGKKASA